MEPVLRISYDGHHFDLRGLKAKEMAQVKTETGLRSRREFFDAITDEDPDAMIAAFALARRREGENVRWSDVDVDLDQVEAGYYDDTDREVEPVFEMDGDSLLLVKRDENDRPLRDDSGAYIRDPNGSPVGKRDEQGRLVWRYVDTGEPVPPTDSAVTSSPPTTPTPGESSESDSGTRLTSVS